MAGFHASQGGYFLSRAMHDPPESLWQQIWPWIEDWEPRFQARAKGKDWAHRGLDEDDLAARGFLALLRQLRVVLLQDLAILQLGKCFSCYNRLALLTSKSTVYPGLLLFCQPVFAHPDWAPFAAAVRLTEASSQIPESELLLQAVPELSSVLHSTREALFHQSAQNQHVLVDHIHALHTLQASTTASLNALLNGQLPIQIQGIGLISKQPIQSIQLAPDALDVQLQVSISPPSHFTLANYVLCI
jgi:hypothetical protein